MVQSGQRRQFAFNVSSGERPRLSFGGFAQRRHEVQARYIALELVLDRALVISRIEERDNRLGDSAQFDRRRHTKDECANE